MTGAAYRIEPSELPEAWRPIVARALDYLAAHNVPVAWAHVEPVFEVQLSDPRELEDPVIKAHVMIATQLAVGWCDVCSQRGWLRRDGEPRVRCVEHAT